MTDVEYLNSTVYCTLAPSPIHGIGVFAIRDIPAGTPYTDCTNNNVILTKYYTFTDSQFRDMHPEIQKLILDRTIFEPNCVEFLSPNSDAILRSFMNHSADPNTDGVYTLRDIKKGEELTENFFALVPNMHPVSRKHFQHFT